MKVKSITLTITLVLFWAGTGLAADTDPNDARPYIGVMLDPAPLPDLLVKHLNLAPGQGIRIANIHCGSPADKAGLERDDIIIGFQGKDVDDQQKFVDDVRKAGIGTEVSLQIIHLGKRKTVMLKLEGMKGDFDLKYPPDGFFGCILSLAGVYVFCRPGGCCRESVSCQSRNRRLCFCGSLCPGKNRYQSFLGNCYWCIFIICRF